MTTAQEHGVDRRRLLALALACAGTSWLPRRGWSQPRLKDYPFALGVASGSPRADSIVLWTRLVHGLTGAMVQGKGNIAVRWEMADDEAFTRIAASGQSQAAPELAHSVHVEVPGLAPDRWYFYRFMVGDAVSLIGRTRTLPLPGATVARWRLAYASCQKWEDGYFSALRHMQAEEPDAVVFLGDYIYEYPGISTGLRSPGGGWVISLSDYRRRHALYKSDPDLQDMHRACPWLLTWDDHEVQNDYAGQVPGYGGSADPAVAADFAARRQAAYQAYYEHMPLRASVLRQALGGARYGALQLYQRLQLGSLASLHLLDGRQHRDSQACTRDSRAGAGTVDPALCPQWNDPARSMLGMAQEQWLSQSLSQAQTRETRWNLLAQQTLFGRRNFRSGAGAILSNDAWDGYPAARSRLLDDLRRHKVPNPVFLGGDVHANWVGHVHADAQGPGGDVRAVEFCGTSITSKGGGNARLPQLLANNPHWVFADAQEHGYGIVDLSAQQLTTRLRVVSDVRQRDANVRTLATFAVDADRPVLNRM